MPGDLRGIDRPGQAVQEKPLNDPESQGSPGPIDQRVPGPGHPATGPGTTRMAQRHALDSGKAGLSLGTINRLTATREGNAEVALSFRCQVRPAFPQSVCSILLGGTTAQG